MNFTRNWMGLDSDDPARKRKVHRLSPSVFAILSRDGVRRHLVVLMNDGTLTCDCEAGQHGHNCWHSIRVAARLMRNRHEIQEAVDSFGPFKANRSSRPSIVEQIHTIE
jgi:hypothetical protein